MKKSFFLWILAFIITIVTAVYQRLTGPTHPVSGTVQIAEKNIEYKLDRSHGGKDNHEIIIRFEDPKIYGFLYYKRFKTDDVWTSVNLEYSEGFLKAFLPHQPPAGKLEYYLELKYRESSSKIPSDRSVVIRFKDDVPPFILIPHIIAMFFSMVLSNRTGLEIFNNGKNLKKYTFWTLGFLVIGGFIFGPLTQKYAFGALWTGFPFGHDLTDNKTLIALIGWLVALYMYGKSKKPKIWGLFAALLLLIVYLIPHSMMGSELDYNKLDREKNKLESIIKE
jgi:hypothetical protein